MEDCATEKAIAPGTTQRNIELGRPAMVMCVWADGWCCALRRESMAAMFARESEELS
jgi:hypothetical protein